MYKGRLISEIINEWISEKSKRIEKIKKDFKELREILSKPKIKEIRKVIYRIESKN